MTLESDADQAPFTLVALSEDFATWDGPAFAELRGARLRARGPLGMFENEPQLCIEHASQLERLSD
jgi:hypothetical protein